MESIYLTDKQYLFLLRKGRRLLNNMKNKDISFYDSTEIGNKCTKSNVGFCNDAGLCTKGTALFPEEFPGRKSFKYRGENHKCPLDGRKEKGGEDKEYWGIAYFYKCLLFGRKVRSIIKIKQLYDKRIKEFLKEKEV